MITGTYTGNGNATQAITGVGFQPRVLEIYIQRNDYTWNFLHHNATDAVTFFHGGGITQINPDMIVSLDADGFTVGDGTGYTNLFNVNGIGYTYIAWE